jgi:hypothetical protein
MLFQGRRGMYTKSAVVFAKTDQMGDLPITSTIFWMECRSALPVLRKNENRLIFHAAIFSNRYSR